MSSDQQPIRTISCVSFNAFGSPFHAQKVFSTLFTTHVYKRFAYLADSLNELSPDIIMLQEVNTHAQLWFLKRRLGHYKHVYYKRHMIGPKGGIVIFSKLPFSEITYVNFKKSGSYRNKTFIAHLVRRGLLIGKLKDFPIRVINTHLTHNLAHDWKDEKHMRFIGAQLQQIGLYIKAVEHLKSALIVAGDFNVPKQSDAFKIFLKQTDLQDVFKRHTQTTYHEEYTYKDTPLGRIDHIFLYPNQQKISVQKTDHLFEEEVLLKKGIRSYLSDHIGLYAEFKIGD